MFDDVVKELSPGYVLHDHEDVGGGWNDLEMRIKNHKYSFNLISTENGDIKIP